MQKRDYNPCSPDDIDDVRRSLIFHRTRLAELEKIFAAGFTSISEYKDHVESIRVAARHADEMRLAAQRQDKAKLEFKTHTTTLSN